MIRLGVLSMKCLAITAMLSLLIPAATWAGNKPDLSGTWKLDTLRSRFDSVAAPKSGVIKIQHQEPKIHIDLDMETKRNQETEVLDLVTDGSEQKVTIAGQPATADAYWEDDGHLVVEVKRDTPKGQEVETRRMHLGDKGKILTTVLTVKDGTEQKSAYGFYVKE